MKIVFFPSLKRLDHEFGFLIILQHETLLNHLYYICDKKLIIIIMK
jgi:hypothetical protein